MLREDTRVAAVSTSLIHPRDIPVASRWISVAKVASLGKSEKDALQLAKMSSLPPPHLFRSLIQPLTVAHIRASPDFFPCLSTIEHEVDQFDREHQGRKGGKRGGRRIRVSAEEANASP